MDVMDAIYHRRAIRTYSAEPVDGATLRMLVENATQAPSAMNLQPWAFAVVQGGSVLARFSEQAKTHLLKTVAAGDALAPYRERFMDPAFNIFYNAPALIVICATSATAQAAEDCALAAQTLMLAAHAHGLGSCWIGFARPWFNTVAGKAALGIPGDYAPVAPIIIGHASGAAPAHPRRSPEIHWVNA